ncbi:MAG: glycosyltransferase family 2 protein [Deltaproteobacteria bacterium]|nr:glycosyltransferase family 2 protein [Deltaproteobacteria bacterium]MBW2360079.1 glycosyltransferase family 2 protein [Deltaproteobacteria bacterium]
MARTSEVQAGLSVETSRPGDPLISFVAPVLDEGPCVAVFARRSLDAAEACGVACEVVFVDDGSRDDTADEIAKLQARDPRIKSIHFTRSFGHQAALCAGLRFASGDAVVTLDGDLQHPPELLENLLEAWRRGSDVVHTIRIDPPEQNATAKGWTSRLFYRVMGLISGLPLSPRSADFRLMDRRVVDAFNELGERFVFTRGIVPWLGFRDSEVPYRVGDRHSGHTKFSWGRRLRLATDGIFSFSVLPLRVITSLGLCTVLFAFAFGLFGLISYAMGRVDDGGWMSLVCLLLIFGGVQLLSLGVVSEYVGRIHEEVKGRPRYVVDRMVGVEPR